MIHTDPVFLVICRTDSESDGTKGDHVLATKSFFTEREDADSYLATISSSRDPLVVRMEGLYAHTLRALREVALRDLRREQKNAEAQTKTESPADSPESEAFRSA